ncbi:MAG: hypothetical protein M3Q23_04890 [Actinomycetota bacterium]|nr:hypothetical protein [Actinomycetota bacterium]
MQVGAILPFGGKHRVLTAALLCALALAMSGPATSSLARPAAAPAATRSVSLDAFRGLGSWVDIYDTDALDDPTAAVAVMAAHGVRTLFLETGNYRHSGMVYPGKTAEFIRAAHARGMEVVAWYLPLFKDVDTDLARVERSLQFRTSDGQAFDSFGLDIEANVVSPKLRIQHLLELSARIRDAVGPSYPLAAIIPSPRGMIRVPTYWPGFPYKQLPKYYDVVMPMSYYTFHTNGPWAAHKYISDNIRIVRERTGDPTIPIHVIGGLTEDTSTKECRAFMRGVRENGILGGSLYEYAGMTSGQWAALQQIPANPVERPALPVPAGGGEALGNIPGGDTTHPKEVFFAENGSPGAWKLSYRVFDVQTGELQIFVNWRLLGTVYPTEAGKWSRLRTRSIDDSWIDDSGTNFIAFVAAGDFPDWSTWGVRDVAVRQA